MKDEDNELNVKTRKGKLDKGLKGSCKGIQSKPEQVLIDKGYLVILKHNKK